MLNLITDWRVIKKNIIQWKKKYFLNLWLGIFGYITSSPTNTEKKNYAIIFLNTHKQYFSEIKKLFIHNLLLILLVLCCNWHNRFLDELLLNIVTS